MRRDAGAETSNSRLVDAVRRVKMATADRNDVVVDLKEADRARLEILADEMRPVFEEVPLEDTRFDFAISSGLQPRLWIDATAHVIMGRDRRTYRFVRDTRVGRVVLAESMSIEPVVDRITLYIAERLHEREMALAADEIISYRPGIAQRPAISQVSEQEQAAALRRHRLGPASTSQTASATSTGSEEAVPVARQGKPDPNTITTPVWAGLAVVVLIGVLIIILRDYLL